MRGRFTGGGLNFGGAATTPSPLLGEGWGGGSGGCGNAVPSLTTPTPTPSPQGGGEEFAALLGRTLAPMRARSATGGLDAINRARSFTSPSADMIDANPAATAAAWVRCPTT